MRSLILIFTICLFEINLFAYNIKAEASNKETETQIDYGEYQPLLVEGREWVVAHGYLRSNCAVLGTHQLLKVKVDGEELIEGKMCKKVHVKDELYHQESEGYPLQYGSFCTHVPNGDAIYYLYEENRRIFVYRNPGPYYAWEMDEYTGFEQPVIKYGVPYFDLYMDLNYGVGDKYEDVYNETLKQYTISGFGEVQTEEYKDYNGLQCRTLQFSDGINWIEGIGSNSLYCMYDPFRYTILELPTCGQEVRYTRLISCKQGDEYLYDDREWGHQNNVYIGEVTSGVESKDLTDIFANDDNFYDLQGVRISTPQSGEIYIHKGHRIVYK